MKNIVLISLLCLAPAMLFGQGLFVKADDSYSTYKYCLKENKNSYLLVLSTTFLAGMLNGVNQDLQFHYWEFARTFPRANENFWNPAISWKNKHEWRDGVIVGEKFPLSRSLFVFTTDGKHITDTGGRLLTTASIIFSYNKKKNWKHYLLDAAILTVVRNLGFHLTYSLIVK